MTNYAKNETEEVAEIARETFSYSASTGEMIRLKSRHPHQHLIGKSAYVEFTSRKGMKYYVVSIRRRQYRAHRICWLLHFGAWPKNLIGHENGNGRDNRIENLKDITHSENSRNLRLSENSSGHTGIVFRGRNKNRKWMAQIGVGGKCLCIGFFEDINDAIAARKEAEVKYGFHHLHGSSR